MGDTLTAYHDMQKEEKRHKTSEEIKGIGPDAPITTNERGGKQSATPYGFHLMDPKASFVLAEVLAYGATRYGRDNWRYIDVEDHLNHALQHIFAFLDGDTQDDHLEHALCRVHMAVAVDRQDPKDWMTKDKSKGVDN
jgi:hypothetical protein